MAAEKEAQQARELEAARRLAEEQQARASDQALAAAKLRRQRRWLVVVSIIAIGLCLTTWVLLIYLAQISGGSLPKEGARISQARELTGHTDWVNSVAFGRTGTQIVSGSDDRTVRVWDVAAGEQLSQLTGHAGTVESVAFSPNGHQIVSGGSDGTVRVWDVAAGEEVHG